MPPSRSDSVTPQEVLGHLVDEKALVAAADASGRLPQR
jgi:hypothetical protein